MSKLKSADGARTSAHQHKRKKTTQMIVEVVPIYYFWWRDAFASLNVPEEASHSTTDSSMSECHAEIMSTFRTVASAGLTFPDGAQFDKKPSKAKASAWLSPAARVNFWNERKAFWHSEVPNARLPDACAFRKLSCCGSSYDLRRRLLVFDYNASLLALSDWTQKTFTDVRKSLSAASPSRSQHQEQAISTSIWDDSWPEALGERPPLPLEHSLVTDPCKVLQRGRLPANLKTWTSTVSLQHTSCSADNTRSSNTDVAMTMNGIVSRVEAMCTFAVYTRCQFRVSGDDWEEGYVSSMKYDHQGNPKTIDIRFVTSFDRTMGNVDICSPNLRPAPCHEKIPDFEGQVPIEWDIPHRASRRARPIWEILETSGKQQGFEVILCSQIRALSPAKQIELVKSLDSMCALPRKWDAAVSKHIKNAGAGHGVIVVRAPGQTSVATALFSTWRGDIVIHMLGTAVEWRRLGLCRTIIAMLEVYIAEHGGNRLWIECIWPQFYPEFRFVKAQSTSQMGIPKTFDDSHWLQYSVLPVEKALELRNHAWGKMLDSMAARRWVKQIKNPPREVEKPVGTMKTGDEVKRSSNTTSSVPADKPEVSVSHQPPTGHNECSVAMLSWIDVFNKLIPPALPSCGSFDPRTDNFVDTLTPAASHMDSSAVAIDLHSWTRDGQVHFWRRRQRFWARVSFHALQEACDIRKLRGTGNGWDLRRRLLLNDYDPKLLSPTDYAEEWSIMTLGQPQQCYPIIDDISYANHEIQAVLSKLIQTIEADARFCIFCRVQMRFSDNVWYDGWIASKEDDKTVSVSFLDGSTELNVSITDVDLRIAESVAHQLATAEELSFDDVYSQLLPPFHSFEETSNTVEKKHVDVQSFLPTSADIAHLDLRPAAFSKAFQSSCCDHDEVNKFWVNRRTFWSAMPSQKLVTACSARQLNTDGTAYDLRRRLLLHDCDSRLLCFDDCANDHRRSSGSSIDSVHSQQTVFEVVTELVDALDFMSMFSLFKRVEVDLTALKACSNLAARTSSRSKWCSAWIAATRDEPAMNDQRNGTKVDVVLLNGRMDYDLRRQLLLYDLDVRLLGPLDFADVSQAKCSLCNEYWTHAAFEPGQIRGNRTGHCRACESRPSKSETLIDQVTSVIN
eukprot:SAG31_NODE_2391_length_5799_cov_3.680526_1_plen_1128_part_10